MFSELRFERTEARRALVDLRDLVPEQQIADAIAATPIGAAGSDSPKSRDLVAVLYDVAQRGLGQTEDTCFTADEAVSSSFNVTSVDRTGVRVTLGLSAPPSCKYNLRTIDVRVPVAGKLTRLLAGIYIVLARQIRSGHHDWISGFRPTADTLPDRADPDPIYEPWMPAVRHASRISRVRHRSGGDPRRQ